MALDPALPAVPRLLGPLSTGPKNAKASLYEGRGQQGRAGLDGVEGQVVLPGVQRLARGQSGDAGDGAWLPHHEPRGLREAGGGEVRRPVEARRLGAEVGPLPVVVGLGDVARVLRVAARSRCGSRAAMIAAAFFSASGTFARPSMRRCAPGTWGGSPPSRPTCPRSSSGRACRARPGQERRVVRRVVQVLRHPEAEQILGVEVGGVERVYVGAQAGAEDVARPFRSRMAAMASSVGCSGVRPAASMAAASMKLA